MSKEIPLTQGKVAIVDDEDWEELAKYKWYIDKAGKSCYASRTEGNGSNMKIKMHRHLLRLKKGDGIEVDHANNNGLDNRRSNLRTCTRGQNRRNGRFTDGCASKYRGVYRATNYKSWVAQIRIDKKCHYLGHFDDEIDAARAYDAAVEMHCGEFARLNRDKFDLEEK